MFLTKIRQNLESLKPAPKKLVVGVSGGPDSVALALVLKEMRYDIVIAHLNHGLRGKESDKDAEFVGNLAQKLGVECVIQKINIPKKGNLEENARRIRYRFLEGVRKKHRADGIVTGHHQGDQVETILMNLARGAGLRGLGGMRPQSENRLRPMLNITKKEIGEYLKQKKQEYRSDSSNNENRFLRNRLRHTIIPKFAKENPYFIDELLAISKRAQEELKELVRRAGNWLLLNRTENGFERNNFQLLHPTLKGEVLIQLLGARNLYAKHINKLIKFIETGQSGKQMRMKGKRFTIEYDRVLIGDVKAAPMKLIASKKRITRKGITWGRWKIKKEGRTALFARPWKPGDRFQPAGMKGTKKVQDFFVDKKIPRSRRLQIPIIVNAKDEIVSVGNLRLDERAKNMKEHLIIR